MIDKMPMRHPSEMTMTMKMPTLADALDDKTKVKKIFHKYGKPDPYQKRKVQWEGDNQS